MAADLPVIATSGVALASVVKDKQVGYVPELNISAIASALEHCINNPQDAKELGERPH